MGSLWKGRKCWAVMRVARAVGGTEDSCGFWVSWRCLVGVWMIDVPPHVRRVVRMPSLASVAGSDGMGIFVDCGLYVLFSLGVVV